MLRRRQLLRVALRLAAAGLLSVCVLVVLLWVLHNRPVTLPVPTGPFAVGRVEYHWVDAARREQLGGDEAANRELVSWVWYPAAPQPGASPAPYLSARWRAARERDYGVGVLLSQNLGAVRAHAVADAPVAPTRPAYPVVILLPGLGPIVADYTTLAENLASHGYVVVGLTPTYSAGVVVFPDGRVARSTAAGNPPDSTPPEEYRRALARVVAIWAADASFALDRLTQLNAADPAGRFTGRFDLGAAGIVGHSLGGATAAEACATDPRFRTGIDLDGYPYGAAAQTGVAQPFLFVWSEPLDAADPEWQQALRDATAIAAPRPGGDLQLTITGARHFNFADYALLYTPVVKLAGGLGAIDGRRGLAIATAYVEAFLDRNLQGRPAPLLAGPMSEYPEVQFGSGGGIR